MECGRCANCFCVSGLQFNYLHKLNLKCQLADSLFSVEQAEAWFEKNPNAFVSVIKWERGDSGKSCHTAWHVVQININVIYAATANSGSADGRC
jgi:hypothetical protein